jgi:hypothetical protein
MGYTHYWERPEELDRAAFAAFASDCRRIFTVADAQGLALADGVGQGAPHATEDSVVFNGAAPDDHETFAVDRLAPKQLWREGPLTFTFCKTRLKRYDTAVTAVLIAVKRHFPMARVSSDGDDGCWDAGRALCQTACGYGDRFHITYVGDDEVLVEQPLDMASGSITLPS